MKVGKISEVALKRAVLKQLNNKREEVLFGGSVGEDCAAMKLEAGEVCVFSSNPVTGAGKIQGQLAICSAVNNLAASGAEAVGVMMTVLLPENFKESRLTEIFEEVEKACQKLNIQVMGGHTEVTMAVNEPVFSVTAVGKVKENELRHARCAKADQDIVMSKWIGMEGSVAIVAAKEKELSAKITEAQNRLAEINVLKTHIVNYSKTRNVYVAYRKSGYSKKFLEEHEADIIIHKAAKKAFDEMGVKKLPTIKSLQVEFADLLTAKKEAYAELKKVRDELRDLTVHKANYEELRDLEEREKRKEKEHGRE